VELKLLSYNIRHGGVGREKYLAAVIKECNPDLVVFQEATHPHVIERLSETTGLNIWAAKPGQSLGFISRIEIAYYQWYQPKPSRRSFLEIVPTGTDFRIFGLHLSAVHSNWTESRRVREMHAVLKSIEQHQEGFHVLVGDFNTLAPGELLDIKKLPPRLKLLVWLSGGKIRWRTIQIMLDANYIDSYRLLHPLDTGYTFPTWDPHIRLDYTFVPSSFTQKVKACRVMYDIPEVKHASDHFPVLTELDVFN
jgi:endonuclease/exonuclease/phosphatase family metal-dependent hydrolase